MAARWWTGTSASGKFIFSTGITAVDPGDGKLKLNNACPGFVTEIYIDKLTTDAIDIGAVLENLATDDDFRIQVAADDDNNGVYQTYWTSCRQYWMVDTSGRIQIFCWCIHLQISLQ